MIVIPRGLARSVRELARRCVSGRPRGPAPPVAIESRDGTLTVLVRTADAALVHAAPTRCPDGVLVVPMEVLAAAEGAGDDPVKLAAGPGLRGEARWAEGGVPRAHPFEAVRPETSHRPPAPPAHWHPAPPSVLTALHECGRAAARAGGGRYALTRVQVRGSTGQVVGTDGRVALVWGGFALPVGADVLVPTVPVFGARKFACAAAAVRVGRTADEVVVAAGPWRVHLPVDAGGTYPDVAAIVPRAAPTTVELDVRDATELREQLPALPGAAGECRPVTLDVDAAAAVLGRDEASGRVEAVRLARSAVTGPPARVAVDRRVLGRALTLGCHTVRVAGPDRPVAFTDGDRTLVAAALDPALAVDPAGGERPATAVPTASPERRIVMSRDPTYAPPDPPAADPPDLLTAAEELRAAVADALTKAGRLVAALKSRRREQRVLSQVWSNLKSLNLGGGGGP